MIRLGLCNEMFEGWELADVCAKAKALGYEGIELAPFTLAERITDLTYSQREEIRETIRGHDLEVIGLHWLLAKTEGFYLTSPDAEVRRRTGEYLVELAKATHELGGKVMVFGSPKQRSRLPGVSYGHAFDYAVDVFRNVMPGVASHGVLLCFEPLAPSETDFVNTIEEADALIAAVGHRSFVLHMDVKAQSADPGGSVPDLIAKHAARAGHFHAQDVNLLGPGMGDVDFGPIMAALVASGYDRWVSVEVFDYSPGPDQIARESIACLKRELERAYRA